MGMTTAIILGAAAAGVSAMGQLAAGEAQKAQYDYQADMTRMQGELSELAYRQEAADIQKEAQRTRAAQITQGAAAGVSTTAGGSLWDVITNSAKTAEEERQSTLRAGRLAREGANVEAASYKNAGKTARGMSYINASTTLLKGASSTVAAGTKAGWFDK